MNVMGGAAWLSGTANVYGASGLAKWLPLGCNASTETVPAFPPADAIVGPGEKDMGDVEGFDVAVGGELLEKHAHAGQAGASCCCGWWWSQPDASAGLAGMDLRSQWRPVKMGVSKKAQ